MRRSIEERAFNAYFRSQEYEIGMKQPSDSDSTVEVANGFKHFVLRNSNGILAVYRVLESERLRRLRMYPRELKRS